METIKTQQQLDRLTRRRDQVKRTLHYIGKEQSQVERNTEWLDQAAYANRVQLLDRLNRWYSSEIKEINKALDRIAEDTYGRCAACHALIEPSRLDSVPEAEFCAGCQELREAIAQ